MLIHNTSRKIHINCVYILCLYEDVTSMTLQTALKLT